MRGLIAVMLVFGIWMSCLSIFGPRFAVGTLVFLAGAVTGALALLIAAVLKD